MIIETIIVAIILYLLVERYYFTDNFYASPNNNSYSSRNNKLPLISPSYMVPIESDAKYGQTKFNDALYDDITAVNNEYYEQNHQDGDNPLAQRMLYNGKKNKTAIDSRSRYTKSNAIKYFDEELRSCSNSIWWDDDSLEHKF